MSYCANCGTQLEAGQKFCANCGTPVPEENEAAQLTAADPGVASTAVSAEASFAPTAQQTSSDAALQKLKELKANLPVRKRSSKKILTVTAIAILMGGVAAIGAVVYVGSRPKQSASTALNKLQRNGETVPPGEDSTNTPDGDDHGPTGVPNDD